MLYTSLTRTPRQHPKILHKDPRKVRRAPRALELLDGVLPVVVEPGVVDLLVVLERCLEEGALMHWPSFPPPLLFSSLQSSPRCVNGADGDNLDFRSFRVFREFFGFCKFLTLPNA